MKRNFIQFFRFMLGKKKTTTTSSLLANQDTNDIEFRLEQLMQQKKPFLRPGYSMKDMAEELQIPPYLVSAFINQHMGMHFTEYLNKHRISYCEELFKKESSRKLTVQELAVKCGFQNRNTFTTAFKKFTGHNPSEYVRAGE